MTDICGSILNMIKSGSNPLEVGRQCGKLSVMTNSIMEYRHGIKIINTVYIYIHPKEMSNTLVAQTFPEE